MKLHNGSILIVDDDEHVLITSQVILKQYFENIELLSSPKTLESRLRQSAVDVVLLDMNFKAGTTNGNEGIYWLQRIRKIAPHTRVVLQTAYADIDLAVRAIKEGGVDFLAKPWDKNKLVDTLLTAIKLAHAANRPGLMPSTPACLDSFIATAPSMQRVLELISRAAPTDANILILGENGTGKEVVAREVHKRSGRSGCPFVSIDIGAVPSSLFESEIFGHEKGAFTDAKESRPGKFEIADKGTLFLDEIGNLTPDLQVKLLSVLQTRAVTRLGSNTRRDLDVRIVSATNASVRELVNSGSLRQDLYYRINTVEIHLPPLRERQEDIHVLLDHYVMQFANYYDKKINQSEKLARALTQYHWPGNIRELKHAVERAVILCEGEVLTEKDFQLHPIKFHAPRETPTLNLSEVEKDVISQALAKCNWNLTRTSEELGIGRSTLYRKILEYGLQQ
jgi:two-component system, NtrC family, response regulator HydG